MPAAYRQWPLHVTDPSPRWKDSQADTKLCTVCEFNPHTDSYGRALGHHDWIIHDINAIELCGTVFRGCIFSEPRCALAGYSATD